jgi:uncharacterized membrane protein YidH (DUF202 family)
MNKIKIHPLILLGLAISALAMGMRAYESYGINKEGYGITFILLSIFFAVLAVYGWMRNQRIDKLNRRMKKGQKLIR